jgi:hypothetical protein
MPGVMQSMSPIGGMGQMNGMPFTGMGGWSMNLSQSMPVQPLPGAHSNFVQAHQRVMGQQTYQEEMAALSDGWERLFKADDSGNGYGNTGCGGGGGSDGGVYDGSAYGGGGPRFTPTTFPSSGAHGGLMDMSRPGATATSRYSPQDDPAVYEGTASSAACPVIRCTNTVQKGSATLTRTRPMEPTLRKLSTTVLFSCRMAMSTP